MESDAYKTLAAPVSTETKVLASRFLAFAHPVGSREDAIGIWKGLQRQYHDATHHCYAFRLGTDGSDFRSNDDGEPSGTAGRPILAALERKGLTNVVVVVVRYFGGTKLGVGGLRRAYAEAAEAVLSKVKMEDRFCLSRLVAVFRYDLTARVLHAISQGGGKVVNSDYGEKVKVEVEVRTSQAESLRAALANATNGSVAFENDNAGLI